MRLNGIFAVIGAAALVFPVLPVPAKVTSILLASCGDLPPVAIDIPGKPEEPDDGHGCCKQACHAANERKKKDSAHGCC